MDGSIPNATVESNLTFDGSILNVSGRIIASASSTDDLVRITQTGTGNSFLVEDSTNPDSTSFVIDNAGNVGMGTLTPQTVLHIKSNPSSTQTAIIRLESDAYTANSSIAYYSGGVNRWEVGTGIALGALYEIYDRVVGQTRFSITTGGATAFLNGNVGVGTPSPSYSVHILGTMSTTNFIMTNGATNGYVLTSDASGNAIWQPGGGTTITNYGNNRVITSDGTTTGLVGETNMTFDGSTLVVTATNSTTATLIIASGSTTSDLVRITQTGAGNAFVVEDSTNPDNSKFIIDNAGNVSIGLNDSFSPTKLYVSANSTQTYAVQGTSIILGGYGGKFYGHNGGFFEGGGNGAGTSTISYGLFASAHDSITNIAVLGIADNNESYIATTNIGAHFIAENGVNNYSLRLQDGTAGINKLLVDVTGNGEANWTSSIKVTSIIASASSTSDLVRITQTGTGNALVVEDSTNPDTTAFVITNSGNVGIGVTATSNKFEVSGNMKLTGTFSGTNNNYVSSDSITQTVLLFLSNNC